MMLPIRHISKQDQSTEEEKRATILMIKTDDEHSRNEEKWA